MTQHILLVLFIVMKYHSLRSNTSKMYRVTPYLDYSMGLCVAISGIAPDMTIKSNPHAAAFVC